MFMIGNRPGFCVMWMAYRLECILQKTDIPCIVSQSLLKVKNVYV